MDDLQQHLARVLRVEWRFAGDQFEQQHADGKNVGSRIHPRRVDLLWRHVLKATHHLPWPRQFLHSDLRDPEINNLGGSVFQDHDIGGLDVAVGHVALMRVLNPVADLDDYLQFLFE